MTTPTRVAPSRRARAARPGPGLRVAGPAPFTVLLATLLVATALATLLAVSTGAVEVAPARVVAIVADHLLPGSGERSFTVVEEQIVWEFRVPRALLALLVGAGLAVVGAVLQAVVRNPLADPFLLGVSSDGALGAVLFLVYGSAVVGALGLSAAAFTGSLVALGLVYLLAQRAGRITPGRLLLSGVAMAYLFQSLFSYMLQQARTGQAAQQVLFWLLGSLAAARWSDLLAPSVVLSLGIGALLVRWRPLNALVAGEETSTSLGVDVTWFRAELFVLTSLLVGCWSRSPARSPSSG